MPLSNEGDEALTFVCLQWATVCSAVEEHDAEVEREDRYAVAAEEGFAVVSFQGNVSMVQAVRADIAVHPFMKELPWISHRIYDDMFFRELGMKRSRLHECNRVYLVLVLCKDITCTS